MEKNHFYDIFTLLDKPAIASAFEANILLSRLSALEAIVSSMKRLVAAECQYELQILLVCHNSLLDARRRLISFNIRIIFRVTLVLLANKLNTNKFNTEETSQQVQAIKIPGRQLDGKLTDSLSLSHILNRAQNFRTIAQCVFIRLRSKIVYCKNIHNRS